MEPFDTYEHAGHIVKLYYDEDPQHANPREDDGNVGVMLCWHGRYNLGDEQFAGDDFSTDVTCSRCDGDGCDGCDGNGYVTLSLEGYLKRERGATVVLPLGLLDHSGISMYVGSGAHPYDSGGWDSGQVGVIFDTPETRKELTDLSPEGIEKCLRDEVEIYDQFLRGEVYGYVVETKTGEHEDSCWGFLGDLEYVKSEANAAAEHAQSVEEKERTEAIATLDNEIAQLQREDHGAEERD